ncbi:MAG: hypothetical protein P8P29_01530 [Flavobacteriaceae bacterium]|nr:hypothetical protein [Flavobacteriaceae bacterium]
MAEEVTVQDLIEEQELAVPAPVAPFKRTLEAEAELRRASQNTFLENVVTGSKDTAAAATAKRMADEGQAALEQYNLENPLDRAPTVGDYGQSLRPSMTPGQLGAAASAGALAAFGGSHDDGEQWLTRSEDLLEMGKDLSQDDREALYEYTNKAAAVRALARINTTRARHARTALQYSGGGVRFVSAMADLDLALGPAGLGLNRVRKSAQFVTKNRFLQSRIVGSSGGFQAGAVVGGFQAMTDDTADEATFVLNVLMGTTLGAALGGPTGDLRVPSQAMYDAYKTAIENNDPKLTATVEPPVESLTPSRVTATNEVLDDAPDAPVMAVVGSVGAARTVPDHVAKEYAAAVKNGADDTELQRILDTPAPTHVDALRNKDSTVPISDVSENIINQAHEEMLLTGTLDARNVKRTVVEDVSTSKLSFLSGTYFHSRLANSRASTALYMARNIFESATGVLRGEDNAAMLSTMYTGQIAQEIRHVPEVRAAWAQQHMPGVMTTIRGKVGGTTQAATRAFNRLVILERNARQNGAEFTATKGATTNDVHVLAAADMYDKAAPVALQRMKGRDGQTPVRGARDIADNPHYNPQRANGSAILGYVREGRVTRREIRDAMASGLRSGNENLKPKDAKLIAEAMIARAEAKQAGADMQAMALLEGDGSDWLEDTLTSNGVSKRQVAAIMKRLRGDKAERSKLGATKRRNTVDMSIQIGDSDLQLVDLFDMDLDTSWSRYSREVGGASALARHGIDSKAAREEWITAMRAEQRAIGEEPMHPNELRAMFSEFDAGPKLGWSPFAPDAAPVATEQWVGDLQRMTNLAWLNKIIFAQAGEYGPMIWQAGLKESLDTIVMRQLNAAFREQDARLLDEFGGDFMYTVGKDEIIFNPHLDLDNIHDIADRGILAKIRKGTQEASRIQGMVTFFNALKGSQQKTAAKMAMNTIFRDIKRGFDLPGGTVTDHQRKLLWNNFGISDAFLLDLEDLVHSGAIEFDAMGHVMKLNGDRWSPAHREKFGALIMRNIDQVVQKAAAGEKDAWMSTIWGKSMTHLKTFPMLAPQKQLVRMLRNGNAEALGATMFALVTAGMASIVRAGFDGKLDDMSAEDHAKRAFGYSNMTGFVPMLVDPGLTMMGYDDRRFNQYGKHAEIGGMAALQWANDAIRVPGAAIAAASGTANYDDKAALRTLPFANMILIGDYMTSLGQANK